MEVLFTSASYHPHERASAAHREAGRRCEGEATAGGERETQGASGATKRTCQTCQTCQTLPHSFPSVHAATSPTPDRG